VRWTEQSHEHTQCVENKQQQNTGRHRRTDITTTTTVCVCVCVQRMQRNNTPSSWGERARNRRSRESGTRTRSQQPYQGASYESAAELAIMWKTQHLSLSSQDGRGLSPPKKTTPGQRTSRPHRSHSVDGGAQTNAQNGTTVAEQNRARSKKSTLAVGTAQHSTVRHGVVWCGVVVVGEVGQEATQIPRRQTATRRNPHAVGERNEDEEGQKMNHTRQKKLQTSP
jgi:hypothetical protein